MLRACPLVTDHISLCCQQHGRRPRLPFHTLSAMRLRFDLYPPAVPHGHDLPELCIFIATYEYVQRLSD